MIFFTFCLQMSLFDQMRSSRSFKHTHQVLCSKLDLSLVDLPGNLNDPTIHNTTMYIYVGKFSPSLSQSHIKHEKKTRSPGKPLISLGKMVPSNHGN